MIYVGGKTEKSNIEVHDLRFSVGEKIEDCYEDLRRDWWGIPESLHIDCWGILNHADGFNISLGNQNINQPEKLYFLNLGGYDPKEFTELHKNVLIVAETESKAKVKALKQILDWQAHHKDHQIDIEQTICLTDLMIKERLYIHLEKSSSAPEEFHFVSKYMPLST